MTNKSCFSFCLLRDMKIIGLMRILNYVRKAKKETYVTESPTLFYFFSSFNNRDWHTCRSNIQKYRQMQRRLWCVFYQCFRWNFRFIKTCRWTKLCQLVFEKKKFFFSIWKSFKFCIQPFLNFIPGEISNIWTIYFLTDDLAFITVLIFDSLNYKSCHYDNLM